MSHAWNVSRAASTLIDAEDRRQDIGRITAAWPELDLPSAYAVQDATLQRRLARGERLTGVKLGLTSVAKQERMGVSSPLTAWLTDAMTLLEGQPVVVSDLIHPRVEPEIVFVLGEAIRGPGVTVESALASVATVHAGLEVIDSRFRDFSFALPDVVADNASSGLVHTATAGLAPGDLDLAAELCTLSINGEVVDRATGAAVLGHPAHALALAANTLAARGVTLQPGWVVYTGGLTDAVHIAPGDLVTAEFTNLGKVSLGTVAHR
jgi:2-oxo-3-hexenedioate decarboxylase